jgi:hypothetical protein
MRTPPAYSFAGATRDQLNYRPSCYIADWHPSAAILQNIVGDARREMVRHHLQAVLPDWGDPIDGRCLDAHLAPALREAFVAADPFAHAPGEFLPRYRSGEVELARVIIRTAPTIIYSLRARQLTATGRRRYRMVDEHGTSFTLLRKSSKHCLSFGEIIHLIDSAQPHTLAPLKSLLPEGLLVWCGGSCLGEARMHGFISVQSEVYPGLGAFYARRLHKVVMRILLESAWSDSEP